jgi:hypothetical protein
VPSFFSIFLAAALLQGGSLPPIELRNPNPNPHGTVGLCIRWGEDPKHVADVVVVVSSGDEDLDQGIAGTVRRMEWDRPTRGYHHEWMGINLAVGANPDLNQPLPKCDGVKASPAPPVQDRT